MRLVYLEDDRLFRTFGALVVRTTNDGSIAVEFGPADGTPTMRLLLNRDEAANLSEIIESVANGGSEQIMLAEK